MRRAAGILLFVGACSQRIAVDELPDDVLEPDAPGLIAKAECAPLFECECGNVEYEDLDECVDERTAEYEAAAVVAMEDGLAYDGECVAAINRWHAEVGCALQSTFTFPAPERPACHPYARQGAASMIECTLPAAFGSNFATPCKGGELCIDGRCSPPWWEVGREIGEQCAGPEGCRYPGVCVDDECVARIPEGGLCGADIFVPCDPETYCDGSACVPKRGPGEPCEGDGYDASCVNLACADGVCADDPLQCIAG